MSEADLILSMDSAAAAAARDLSGTSTDFITAVGWIVPAYDGGTPYEHSNVVTVPGFRLTTDENGGTASQGTPLLQGLLSQGYTALMRTYSLTHTITGVTHTS